MTAGCALVAAGAMAVLAGGGGWEVRFAAGVPGGDWIVGADMLSAFFLLPISLVGAAAAVYGAGYLDEHAGTGRAGAHAGVAVLVAALMLAVTARAAMTFLVAWEVISIAAFLLVMFHHEEAATRRAGLLYLVATHTATLALIGMFALWGAQSDDLSFVALARSVPALPASTLAAMLFLALVGFGLKAGLVPLHVWLPGAHAAAPSHVSALMSGLVIKIGIYGLLRVLMMIGTPPAWYGWTLLSLGIASAVLGVVWALAQHDLKRLLAYHSVENIGIIAIGIGAGALGQAYQVPALALLGYAGAILHVLNHALFKSLLFLGAGAVVRAAGTRRIDALGGLGRLMPVSATLFLLASAAIVGLPPLNGFVSEWLVVLALLAAGQGQGAVRAAVFGVAALGLAGGLALACFAKVNGVVFLGRARSAGAAAARECGLPLLGPMIALAAACVAIGLLPWLIAPSAFAAAGLLAPAAAEVPGMGRDLFRLSTAAMALVAAGVVAMLLRRAVLRGRWRIVARTWGCGYLDVTPRMQYTASSFAEPVLEPFGAAAGLRPARTAAGFGAHVVDPVLDGLLQPAWVRLRRLATRLPVTAPGRLYVALLYVFATVIVLLGYLSLRQVS